MSFKKKTIYALMGVALTATSLVASAVTLRIGNQRLVDIAHHRQLQ